MSDNNIQAIFTGENTNYPPGWNDPPPSITVGTPQRQKKRLQSNASSLNQSTTGIYSVSTASQSANGDLNTEQQDQTSADAVDVDLSSVKRDLLAAVDRGRLFATSSGAESQQIRLFEDAERRLQPLLEDPSKPLTDPQQALAIGQCLAAISAADFTAAGKLITAMMTSGFSGNQWILGLKRLNDLLKSSPVNTTLQ